MIRLVLHKILDFYDLPQLFVAKDAMDVSYVCVLYDQQDGFHYLGVQVSDLRLQSFCAGQLDLRRLYEQPEQDNTLYEVVVHEEQINAMHLLKPAEVAEHMLPAAGYYYETETADADTAMDTLQLNIPAKDRSFVSDMVKRMGWTISTMSQATRRIAVL